MRLWSHGVADHQTAGGPSERNLTIAFRYLDRLARCADEWRIADRRCKTEWVRVNDPATSSRSTRATRAAPAATAPTPSTAPGTDPRRSAPGPGEQQRLVRVRRHLGERFREF